MGRLNYETIIQHFSHPHPLELSNIPDQPSAFNLPPCSGCNFQPSGLIYSCKTCNFILHMSCSQMPQLISHPVDTNHPLSLLPSLALYPDGFFNCNACGEPGNGFCYHCRACNLNLHMPCASMPMSINHQAHPHTLNLTFFFPYPSRVFQCDICSNHGSTQWIYRCGACGFDAHMNCATSPVVQATMATQNTSRNQGQGGAGGRNISSSAATIGRLVVRGMLGF